MSERPATLQLLKKGKLLCSAVFPAIVETWNWLVEAFDGLKGDYDLNREEGSITVDRSDPAHPVIRLAKPVKAEGGESGGAGMPQFEFKNGSISGGVVCISRRYYKVDGVAASGDGEYRLKFEYNSGVYGYGITIEKGSGFDAPTDDLAYAPLFKVEDGAVAEDYRGAVYLVVRE